MITSILVSSSALALMGAQATDAGAAEPAVTQAAEAEADSGLGDIVVTARRRAESQQAIPVAVTALSSQVLKENNVQSIEDLVALTPGLTAATNATYSSLTIRGQGTGTLSGTPGSHLYFDEVPVPFTDLGTAVSGPGIQYDLSGIQVLKGPQGTLFGRNSVGGALLLTTARPEKTFGGYLEASAGSFNNRQLTGAINIPFGDLGGLRIAGDVHERDGYVFLVSHPKHPKGIDLQDVSYRSGRISVDLFPADGLKNELTFHYYKGDVNGEARMLAYAEPNGLVAQLFPDVLTLLAEQRALGRRKAIAVSTPVRSERMAAYLRNLTEYEFSDNLRFRNIIGYFRLRANENADNDGTSLRILDYTGLMPRAPLTRQFTWEPQFQGTAFSALDWVVGYFYLDSPEQKHLVPWDNVVFGSTTRTERTYGERSSAFYAQGTLDLASFVRGVKVTGGIRHTTDTRSGTSRVTALETGACASTGLDENCVVRNHGRWKATTYNVSLDYKFSPDGLVYVASRRGYRGGGFNQPLSDQSLRTFGPEIVVDYELGLKADWSIASRPIRTNIALFRQNYDDIQVTTSVFDPVTNQIFGIARNAGKAVVKGAEVEVTAQPVPDLTVGARFAYLNFKYTRLPEGTEEILGPTATVDRPPYAFSLNARYQLPLDESIGKISINGLYRWQDKTGRYSLSSAGITGSAPAYGTANVGINWQSVFSRPIDAEFTLTNLTNKRYPWNNTSIPALGFGIASYSEPRMAVFRLRYRFGAHGN